MTFAALRRFAPGSQPAVLALSIACVSLCAWIGFHYDPLIAEENHLLENAQVGALALAGIVHGTRAWRQRRRSLGFLLHAGLAMLMYTFLLRELDIRELDPAGAHFWHMVEHVLRYGGVALWLVLLAYGVPSIKQLFKLRVQVFLLPVMLQTLCAGVFLIAGWPFDKEKFESLPEPVSRLIEETLELDGYLILLAASTAASVPAGFEAEGAPDARAVVKKVG